MFWPEQPGPGLYINHGFCIGQAQVGLCLGQAQVVGIFDYAQLHTHGHLCIF